jgi:hypothetical protein
MYKSILLTVSEMKILESIIQQNLKDYPSKEAVNLTVLLSLLKRNITNENKSF